MESKNKLYVGLMTFSILVLVMVQFFWLFSVYMNHKISLKQETGILFTGMLDSLVHKELKQVWIPSNLDAVITDQNFNKLTFQDTLKNILKDWQSLETQEIEKRFNEILASNKYPLVAKIKRFDLGKDSIITPDKAIIFEEVRDLFGIKFIGYIESYQEFIFRKMLLQAFFSFLALIFISWSMLAMYRNMLKQQRLSLLKNDIISNITHELKTPVSTIAIILESLENSGANDKAEKRKEYIQIAKNELKRLNAMADNILKSSLFEKEQNVIFSDLDLDFLLEEKIRSFKPILDSQGFEFRYLKEGSDFKIKGDAEQIGLVIFNLLDNAVKYSRDEKNIEISLKEKENKVNITIKDMGIGIPEAYQKEIFEKFVRVPQQDLSDTKGYGLGLAQVAIIVKAHGGKISLDSQVGKGATFTIQFQKTLP